jgi:hypothetical protein
MAGGAVARETVAGRRRRAVLACAGVAGLAIALSSAGAFASGARQPLLPPPRIVKDLIPFGPKREQEMRRYAVEHYGIDSYKLVDPHLIIWHYTESATFQSVWNTFADDVPDVTYHELPQVCAHFVIDTDGTIYQLVPLDIMCRQVVGLNYTSIGIENVGFSDQQVMDDAAQYQSSLAALHRAHPRRQRDRPQREPFEPVLPRARAVLPRPDAPGLQPRRHERRAGPGGGASVPALRARAFRGSRSARARR